MTPESVRIEILESVCDTGVKLIPLLPSDKAPFETGFLDRPGLLRDDAIAHLRGVCSCRICQGQGRSGNLGIQTGYLPEGMAQLRVNVIDVDMYKGNGIAARLQELRMPSDTWVAKTGRGGLHYYFLADPEKEMISRANHKALGPGFDTKGKGGFVVCPPSRIEGSGDYVWMPGQGPSEIPLPCEMPPHLAALVLSEPKRLAPLINLDDSHHAMTRPGEDPLAGVEGAHEGNRNEVGIKLALRAIRAGVGLNNAWSSFLAWNNRCDPPDEESKVRQRFEWAKTKVMKESPELIEDTRTVIFVSDDLETASESAQRALSASFLPGDPRCIYSQDRRLVSPQGGPGEQPIIQTLESTTLKARLSSCTRFRRINRAGSMAFMPIDVVNHLLKQGHWTHIKPLAGIKTAPFMAPSGRIITKDGYDEDSGFLTMLHGKEFPDINKETVSQREARECYQRIRDPLKEFPWATESDYSAAISLFLTVVARPAIFGCVPLYAIRAHTPGTGKTLLAQSLVAMATGAYPSVSMPVGDSEETRKRLFSMAIEGRSVAIFDNEEGVFGSKALSSIITSGIIEDRILGKSRSYTIPWNTVAIVTGNNLSFRSDQGRRTMIIDLNSEEHPEDRGGFEIPNLLRYCMTHTDEMVLDALRILKGHRESGYTEELKHFGGFEGWSDLIRQALVWVGAPDPLRSRERMKDQDADEDERLLVEFHVAWTDCYYKDWISSKVALENASAELRDVVCEISGVELPSPRDMGLALRKFKGRTLHGRRIEQRKVRSNKTEWRVYS